MSGAPMARKLPLPVYWKPTCVGPPKKRGRNSVVPSNVKLKVPSEATGAVPNGEPFTETATLPLFTVVPGLVTSLTVPLKVMALPYWDGAGGAGVFNEIEVRSPGSRGMRAELLLLVAITCSGPVGRPRSLVNPPTDKRPERSGTPDPLNRTPRESAGIAVTSMV